MRERHFRWKDINERNYIGMKPTQTHLVYVMGFKKQILKLGGILWFLY